MSRTPYHFLSKKLIDNVVKRTNNVYFKESERERQIMVVDVRGWSTEQNLTLRTQVIKIYRLTTYSNTRSIKPHITRYQTIFIITRLLRTAQHHNEAIKNRREENLSFRVCRDDGQPRSLVEAINHKIMREKNGEEFVVYIETFSVFSDSFLNWRLSSSRLSTIDSFLFCEGFSGNEIKEETLCRETRSTCCC